jgi:hypothetical protein
MLLLVLGTAGLAVALIIATFPGVSRWLDWTFNERGRKWFGEEPDVERHRKRAQLLRVIIPVVSVLFSVGCFAQSL